MKKILSIFVLLIVIAMAIFVPDAVHESKQAYEDQMVAVIGTIKARITAGPTAPPLTVGIYAPLIDQPGGGRMFLVSGIVSLRIPGGEEHAERFTADIRNNCKARIDPACLEVRRLIMNGKRFREVGLLLSSESNFEQWEWAIHR